MLKESNSTKYTHPTIIKQNISPTYFTRLGLSTRIVSTSFNQTCQDYYFGLHTKIWIRLTG